jgi:SAM-dependent methyltransferase
VGGYAEALPIKDETMNGVAIGHAAQWFKRDAIDEIHRILRPGGALMTLYISWGQDERTAELTQLMDRYQPPGWLERFYSSEFDDALAADARFEQLGTRSFAFVHTVRADDFAALAATASDVAALPDAVRRALLAEIDGFARRSLPNVYEWHASCDARVHRRVG